MFCCSKSRWRGGSAPGARSPSTPCAWSSWRRSGESGRSRHGQRAPQSSPSHVSLRRSTSGASRPSGNPVLDPSERSEVNSFARFRPEKVPSLVTPPLPISLPVQRGATPLGPPEAPDGEVSAVREGERRPAANREAAAQQLTTAPCLVANRASSRSSPSTARRSWPSAARGANRR